MSDGRQTGRLRRLRRGADGWSSEHDRARALAATRLVEPLEDPEAAWLDGHLAACDECRFAADAYQAERLALRALRDQALEPPRDLWAKTAARIEREPAAHRSRSGSQAPAPGSRRGRATGRRRATGSRRLASWPVWGALSGFTVVALVVIATAMSGGFLGRVTPPTASASPSVALASQPVTQPSSFAVAPGKVRWLGATSDGVFAYNAADIEVVCRHDNAPECPPVAGGGEKRVSLAARPKFVYQSPVDFQAVIVGTDASGADAVLVVTLPTPDPTPSIEAASPAIEASDAPPEAASSAPNESGTPIGDVPSVTTESVPLESATVTASASDLPSAEPGSTDAIAIISGVTVVGRTAAYSPDGSWFAFTARPVDGSSGPDIYVWHVGEPQARPLTVDHASVFSSWVGTNLVGSRLSPDAVAAPDAEPSASGLVEPSLEIPPPIDLPPEPTASLPADTVVGLIERTPEAFLMDPFTGTELGILDTEWQLAVDPTRLAVVAWQGTVGLADDGITAGPASGNIVVHPFHGPLETDDPFGPPPATSSPPASPSPSAFVESPPDVSGPVAVDFPQQVVAAGPIVDFDARWDDTGTWLAIWIADPLDAGLGRLSLLHFDPATGMLDRPVGAPQSVTALPGFSIGYGRLAWVSPPGQSGEGSRIQIAAWSGAEVGAIESVPVKDAIVVQ